MSYSDVSSRKFVTHSEAARIRGVIGRTIDRWARQGIIPPPVKINDRKYHDIEGLLGAQDPAHPKESEEAA